MGYGPQWRLQRSIIHRLLAPKQTLEFVQNQEFQVKHLLYQLALENHDQASLFEHIRRMSLSIVATITHGRRIDSKENTYMRASAEASALMGRIARPGVFPEDDLPPLAQFLPKFLQLFHRRAMKMGDIIMRGKMAAWNQLKWDIDAGVAAPSSGRDLFEKDLKEGTITDEYAAWLMGLLVDAGAEIMSVVLHNLVLFLTANPEVQTRAKEELDRVVGGQRLPMYADTHGLRYLRSCVKEILRLCHVPTWALKHFTDAEVTYKNYCIPKGTVLLVNTSFMHWDPDRFDDLHVYRPERFIHHGKSSAEYAVSADPRERDNFTFGGGRRICPAIRMAENTFFITIASILWTFQIRPPLEKGDVHEVESTVDTSSDAFMTTDFGAPKPFRVRFVPRSSLHLEIVRQQWENARMESYELRGQGIQVEKSGLK